MKKLILLFVLVLMGCASVKVVKYHEPFPPKELNAQIDLYDTVKPEKPYVEIGKLIYVSATSSVNEEKAIEDLKVKARELGADGLILKGFVESNVSVPAYTVGSGNQTTTTYQSKKDYVAVAIKYK